jgi:hypothetical protein|tara:strand:+ start:1158 stop:1613 length:456 start_codon:yes stop_codon:yes gene_type:complete
MDVKIKTEIRRLEELKNLKHREYIFNVEQIEQKIEQSKSQIDRTDSATKRDILKKQKVYYKEEINALDSAIEHFTQSVDEKIGGLYKVLEVWIEKNKLEKESIEYNIEKIRDLIKGENMNDVFEMFNSVANSLEIIDKKLTSSSHGSVPEP